MLVRIVGQAPLAATVYSLARLRCGARGQVFTAQEPEGVGPEKYDETAAAIIAQLKYGSGTPFYRLEQLEGRCSRYELIAIDELGYVPLAEVGAALSGDCRSGGKDGSYHHATIYHSPNGLKYFRTRVSARRCWID